MAQMSGEQRDAFLREPRIATIVTLHTDGSPAAVPIWFEWDGARARVFTDRDSPKVKRMRADPRVCLTIAEPAGVPEAWVSIEGIATIDDGGMALARRLAPRYYAAEKAATALARWEAAAERWVLVTIEPSRIRSLT